MAKHRKCRAAKLQKIPPHRGAVILTDPSQMTLPAPELLILNGRSMPGYRLTTTPPFNSLKPATRQALIRLAEAAAERLRNGLPEK